MMEHLKNYFDRQILLCERIRTTSCHNNCEAHMFGAAELAFSLCPEQYTEIEALYNGYVARLFDIFLDILREGGAEV